ncbi:MAG: trypsin-like peptidase domain-containing protein [Tenericutes bacterium]|jgi:serine protease Do|nr:trypsin-like peptidase domain-containing protein [Mycoplasmatota bacterium]
MKKIGILLILILGAFTLTGCSNIFPLETTSPTTTTTMTEVITSQEDIDYNQLREDVYQDVYNQIYNDLYENIKDDILAEISDEEIMQIYQNVRQDIITQIEDGVMELEALSVLDKMISVGLTSAKAVIGINNLNDLGEIEATGSGVIYKKEGNQYYVITNHHVIEDAASIQIEFADTTTLETELLGVEKLVDIAVLRFTSVQEFPVAPFGDSSIIKKGQFITAVGNPSGVDYFNTMTMGIVSGINRYFDIDEDGTRDMFVNYIQHDAAINAGNSGGALFNLDGEIIGINTLKIVDYSIEGMGFAIPGNLVELIAGDIEEFGESKRKPMLGITFVDISQNKESLLASGALIPDDINEGFYIQDVVAGSSVDGYVLPGDIILEIGDVIIENTSQFVEGFSQYLVGDVIDIVVYRNGNTITLTDIELKGRE